jgi:hypothetical protein
MSPVEPTVMMKEMIAQIQPIAGRLDTDGSSVAVVIM